MAKKSITTDIVPRTHTDSSCFRPRTTPPFNCGHATTRPLTMTHPDHRETAAVPRGSTSPNIRARLVFRPLLGATLQRIWSVWKSISSRDDDDDDDVVMQQWPPFALFWSGRVGSKLSELSVGRGPTTTTTRRWCVTQWTCVQLTPIHRRRRAHVRGTNTRAHRAFGSRGREQKTQSRCDSSLVCCSCVRRAIIQSRKR